MLDDVEGRARDDMGQVGLFETKRAMDLPALPLGVDLSPRQGLMWVDDQLFPSARYHNLPLVIELEGPLDRARFSGAWAEVVASCDALRMSFDPRTPKQSWIDAAPPPLAVIELDTEATAFIAERCARRLEHGGFMWDAALLGVGEARHVFYLCQHHGLADGVSQWVLLEELAARYAGRATPPAPSFRESLRVEAAYLESDQARADRAYWERKLDPGVPPLRPYGIARSDRSVAIDRVWHDAGQELSRQLCERASEPAFASFNPQLSRLVVLLTASAAFLQRVSGNREVVLAVPFANRPPRFARTYGLLMQQLFLRVRIEESDTFASLAIRVKAELASAIRHGRYCVSSRDIDYFRVNLLPALPTRFADLGATMRLDPASVRAGAGAGEGDLRDTLGVQLYDFAGRALELGFDSHAATFDASVALRLRTHFVRVLSALARRGDAAVDTVPLLDDVERRVVLCAARGPEPPGAAADLAKTFVAQARRRADHVAVDGPDATLTYAELDAVSNRLAHRLQLLGVGRESRVGVALPRSAAELVALLATLKAGGAYVPIDPSHPVERVRVMLEDAVPEVFIARGDSELGSALPSSTVRLPIDDLEEVTRGFDAAPLDDRFGGEQLAYILFTSGSTGRPKGVEISRAALANLLRSLAHTPGLAETDRMIAITTTTFDIAAVELFLPLWVGATCTVVDRETALDPRRLRAALESGAFTLLQATPATWRMLIDAGWRGDRRLRMFICGEPLSPELAEALLERGAELWNLYGPTEATVYATGARIERGANRISIGTPIDHTQVYVLDPDLQPVPVGVIGELYIGGAGVARGYHQRPDLTEQRFVADPFGPPNARLYRTGDSGRLLDGGQLECLGRMDHQVKIRGFRIELGEVEAVLRAASGVQDIVVVARGTGSEAKLVAYWKGDAERSALFERARDRLPQYMVPGAFVRLDAFPLTTSGKIDRKALPSPDVSVASGTALRLPARELERRLATIWSEVIGVSPIGVDQEFFALGGTSVMAVAVRNRVEQELGLELPLRALFERPTIEGVARVMEEARSAAMADAVPTPCLVRLRRGTGGRSLFLIHDGDGEVLLYRNLALQMPADVAVYGLVPLAERGLRMVHTTLAEMAGHYLREIRACQPCGPYYLSGLCAGGVIAFEVARQLRLAGEPVALLALIDAASPTARPVPLHTTRERARRLRQLVREAPRRGLVQAAVDLRRRLANILAYELATKWNEVASEVLVAVVDAFYSRSNRSWPARISAPPTVRATYLRALMRYAPEAQDGIPAVLFRATAGGRADPPMRELYQDPCLGWSELLGGTLEVVDVEGSHASMLQAGQVGTLAGLLTRRMSRRAPTAVGSSGSSG